MTACYLKSTSNPNLWRPGSESPDALTVCVQCPLVSVYVTVQSRMSHVAAERRPQAPLHWDPNPGRANKLVSFNIPTVIEGDPEVCVETVSVQTGGGVTDGEETGLKQETRLSKPTEPSPTQQTSTESEIFIKRTVMEM